MPAKRVAPVGNTRGNTATKKPTPIPRRKGSGIPTELAPSQEVRDKVTSLAADLLSTGTMTEEQAQEMAVKLVVAEHERDQAAKAAAKAAGKAEVKATPKTVTRTLKGIRADERVAVAASEAVNENRDAAEIRGSIVGAIEALKWNLNELGLPVRTPALNEDGTPVLDEETGEPMEKLTEIGEHLQAIVAPAVAAIEKRMNSAIVI